MSDNQITLKVFLKDDIRRIPVNQSVCTNFALITEILCKAYPILRTSKYKITWKDCDGDHITIADDRDLTIAFTEMTGHAKYLHITLETNEDKSHTNRNKSRHCPFSNKEGYNVVDLSLLANMAGKYMGCVSDVVNNAARRECGDEQEKMFMENIATLVNTFLGGIPENQQQRQPQQQSDSKEEPKASSSSATSSSSSDGHQAASAPTEPAEKPADNSKDAKMAAALAQLLQMGFSNENGVLTYLLEAFDGNVIDVVRTLTTVKN